MSTLKKPILCPPLKLNGFSWENFDLNTHNLDVTWCRGVKNECMSEKWESVKYIYSSLIEEPQLIVGVDLAHFWNLGSLGQLSYG